MPSSDLSRDLTMRGVAIKQCPPIGSAPLFGRYRLTHASPTFQTPFDVAESRRWSCQPIEQRAAGVTRAVLQAGTEN